MKFKVGDIVKIREDFSITKKYKVIPVLRMEKYRGKITTIKKSYGENYFLEIDNKDFLWSDDMFEPYKMRKSDLKNGDIVIYRNRISRIVVGDNLMDTAGNIARKLSCYTNELKNKEGFEEFDISKVYRANNYETIFERKEETLNKTEKILDETEKKYLAAVIKPFRNKIAYIIKRVEINDNQKCYLIISLKDNDTANLPDFKKDSMYKGMQTDRVYSLEELGL